MTRRLIRSAVRSLVLCTVAGGLTALTPAAPSVAAHARVAITATPEAQAVLDRAVKALNELRSYSDETKLSFLLKGTEDGKPMEESQDMTLRFAFQREGRFRMSSIMDATILSDGTTITSESSVLRQYIQQPYSPTPDWNALAGPMGTDSLFFHPIAAALLSGTIGKAEQIRIFDSITGVKAEKRGDRDGRVVSGKGSLPGMPLPFAEKLDIAAWFDDTTGLPGEIVVDLTPAMKRMVAMASMMGEENKTDIQTARITIAITPSVNTEIPASTFAYTPGEGFKKVDKFEMPMGDFGDGDSGPSGPELLVGLPAPAFAGTGVDGQPLRLEDYKGKVVVLDFWAMWCPPCVRALPIVQKLHDEFADKGVVFIGMNNDGPEDLERLKKFLADRKITFRQFPPDEKVTQAFRIEAFPTMIIIGKDGIVQDVTIGFGPSAEAEKRTKLEKLLKGESLFDPKEVEARRKKAEGDKPASDGPMGR
jgi:thiol-disulfide isomerase/thioredoxin